ANDNRRQEINVSPDLQQNIGKVVGAVLQIGNTRLYLELGKMYSVGSAESCDIVVRDLGVPSRHHTIQVLKCAAGHFVLNIRNEQDRPMVLDKAAKNPGQEMTMVLGDDARSYSGEQNVAVPLSGLNAHNERRYLLLEYIPAKDDLRVAMKAAAQPHQIPPDVPEIMYYTQEVDVAHLVPPASADEKNLVFYNPEFRHGQVQVFDSNLAIRSPAIAMVIHTVASRFGLRQDQIDQIFSLLKRVNVLEEVSLQEYTEREMKLTLLGPIFRLYPLHFPQALNDSEFMVFVNSEIGQKILEALMQRRF
ncbi:hypothetical protein HZB07_03630, partial [Candidatus Saganbacteria bacterium]|nr:hypothetical protein [Candidatus Saganbacteria bacterium]